jgi:K+-sensing histidine kinase KdpD
MSANLPQVTGQLLGTTPEDISGTTWLLGHDLKSPVAIIISTLEMVIASHEDEPEMESTTRLLKGALVAARREYNMICDMLDLARFELNEYQIARHPIDLGELLRETLEEERFSLETKNLKLITQISDQGLLVDGEAELFRRVFSALVDNVLKFTTKHDTLKISATRSGNTIYIEYADTGRPVHADFETSITSRAPHWAKRQEGSRSSVGMGLPFVNAVIKAHNGVFTTSSDASTGYTYFRFSVPALESDRAATSHEQFESNG